jgi:hypothetical protein
MTTLTGVLRRIECAGWVDVLRVVEGCLCYWADLDGLHVHSAPLVKPVASHLWAYDGQHQWFRVRIEDDRFVVVALVGEGLGPAVSDQINVNYVGHTQRAWQPGDRRVQQAKLDEVPKSIEVVEVIGLSPLTFLSVRRR